MPMQHLAEQTATLVKIVKGLEERVNAHDVLLARLEEKQAAAMESITDLADRLDTIDRRSVEIVSAVTENREKAAIVYKLAITLLPLLTTLELWNKLFGG